MSNLNIYAIQQDYLLVAQQIIDNDGELTDELSTALAITQEQLEDKGRGYGFVVKSLEGEVDIIDNEIKRLQWLKSCRNNTIDRLKTTLADAMQLFEINEIKTPTLKINFRKSTSIEVDDMKLLDRKYISVKTTESADKAAIKADIEAGVMVVGAYQKQNLNLQIK